MVPYTRVAVLRTLVMHRTKASLWTREVAQSAGGRDDKHKGFGKTPVSPPVSHALDSPLVRGGHLLSPHTHPQHKNQAENRLVFML